MFQTQSAFLKLESYLDCFAEATACHEFSSVSREADKEEAAYKWLALAFLHGLSVRTDAVEMRRYADGRMETSMTGGKLPVPSPEVGCCVFETLRRVAHLDLDRETTRLALGIRDDSLEFKIDASRDAKEQWVRIEFPRVGTA